MTEDVVRFNTKSSDAIYDNPVNMVGPRFVDVVNTQDLSWFGVYFNGIKVIEGASSPGAPLPGAYALMLRALGIDYDVHVISGDSFELPRGSGLSESFYDLEILDPEGLLI